MRRVFAKVSFVGSDDLGMVGRGWLWVAAAKLWQVVGGCGWWRQNYGWSWVVLGLGGKIMAGCG